MSDQQHTQVPSDDKSWERDIIARLALDALEEQRRVRRWGIFFKSLTFLYLFILLAMYLSAGKQMGFSAAKHTALVNIEGIIAADTQTSADNVIGGLRAAFEDENTKGIILRINSPGGSPVQSGYINDEVFRLREKYPDIPVYAVITDLCASGGYYVAAAAQEIYADKASIVGSIGVRSEGFGFVDTLGKLGVERRLITAGANKGFIDPFQPLKTSDVEHLQSLLDGIHQQFIKSVEKGRGNRLGNNKMLFTGLVWTGEEGLKLGLVDALGSSSYVAREVIGAEKIVDFTAREDYFNRIAKRLGATLANLFNEVLRLR